MIRLKDTGRAGFSLVEILVVLAIVGLMTGAAYLTMRPASDPARAMAEQMQLDLMRAETMAVTRGAFIGLRTSPEGYDFLIYEAGEWRSVDRRSSLAARRLPELVVLVSARMPMSSSPAASPVPDYWFDPTGANDAAAFELETGEARWRISIGGPDGIRLTGGDL